MDERLNHAPCGYISMTQEGVIVDVNDTFLQMVKYEREDLVQKHIESIMSTANKFVFHTYFYPYIRLNGHVEEMFLSLQDSKGIAVPVLLNGSKFELNGLEMIDCVCVSMGKRIDYEQEIRFAKRQIEDAFREKDQALEELQQLHLEIEQKQKELIELNIGLEKLAMTDKLTGLKNRRFFHKKLEELILLFENYNKPFSICVIDIDFFKKVNDTWGHQTGDKVLVQLAIIAESTVRKKDTIVRYGGEEFIIILPQTTIGESKIEAEKLRAAIEDATWETGKITVSIGISTFTLEDNESTIIEKADQALYASKENGRNCVTHVEDM